MSYQVLARKWRPGTFSELAGQEHVQRALINALDSNRIHHAFLFTGTRGVGKTTIARILAKSLNCEQGVSATPCGTCSTCTEITEGRFVDLIEVDAASKTKVEDTRELLENVQYAPTRGRYKVYLIDEVHMLSSHSFNALLKTLEEPPPHVKFLLATTDPQRLPVTILSRCLQFNLKRLPEALIQQHLEHILKQEDITSEPAALSLIAASADGSMRDALSLMDQAIAYGNGSLQTAEVRTMLGTVDNKYIYDIMEQLAARDTLALLERIKDLATQSPDFSNVLNDLMTLLHQIALAQLAPDAIENHGSEKPKILALAEQMLPEDTQLYYQICLIGKKDIKLAPSPKLGFEMTLLRMLAFQPNTHQSRPPPNTPPRATPTDSSGSRSTPHNETSGTVAEHHVAGPGLDSTLKTSDLKTPDSPPGLADQQWVQDNLADSGQVSQTPADTTITDQASKDASRQQKSQHLANISEKLRASTQKKTLNIATPANNPIVNSPVSSSVEKQSVTPSKQPSEPAPALPPEQRPELQPELQPELPADEPGEQTTQNEPISIPEDEHQWEQMTKKLPLNGIALQLAKNCALAGSNHDSIGLHILESHKQLVSDKRKEDIQQAIRDITDTTVKLTITISDKITNTPASMEQQRMHQRQQNAEVSIHNDSAVQQIMETFDAQITPDSIQPIDPVQNEAPK